MKCLVDGNNFFVSCERIFRPDLNDKPVVVVSGSNGCVVARSNEAKALVPMGAPAFKYKEVFKQHKFTIFTTNFALYADLSRRMMQTLATFSPDIEVYSIDECFLDFTGFEVGSLIGIGHRMKKNVQRCLGLPTSIGFAETKTLAKVANHIAKKFPLETGGVYSIDSDEKRVKALKWLKIEDVWGIGYNLSIKLKSAGVFNAYQFTQLSNIWIKNNMSIVSLRLKQSLLGEIPNERENHEITRSFSNTSSFDKTYRHLNEIEERVITLVTRCARRMREQNYLAKRMLLFIHTNRFNEKQPQYAPKILLDLPHPSNSDIELTKFAMLGLRSIYQAGFEYKRAGVVMQQVMHDGVSQMQFFDERNPNERKLMQAVDKINGTYGKFKIHLAAQSNFINRSRKREFSNRYTTVLDEVMTINAR